MSWGTCFGDRTGSAFVAPRSFMECIFSEALECNLLETSCWECNVSGQGILEIHCLRDRQI